MSVVQIVLVGVILLLAVGIALFVVNNREAERKKRMMAAIRGQGISSESGKRDERDEQNKRRAEIAKKLKETKDDEAKAAKKKTTLAMALGQAGLSISPRQFLIYSGVSMVAFAVIAKLMGHGLFIVVMAAVVGFFGFPKLVLRHITKKRQKKFLEEFADALEAMVRLLKAGMPVSEAVSMISREFSGPVGEEMSRIYDKQKIGIPLHEAALEATKRMPLPEMQMFATGLSIQAQTGSSLSEVLLNLAGVIRARFRLKRKIKALSSEAIASASIIGALPNIVALGMWFVNRDYINVLFTDPFGKVLLAIAVIWMLIGIFVMKIMINFKI